MAFFADIPVAKPNPVFMLSDLYKADTNALRLNLGVGAFRDDYGNAVVTQLVKDVELEMAQDVVEGRLNHEYPPLGGSQELVAQTCKLVFGETSSTIAANLVQGVQAVSGSGAVRLVADFIGSFHTQSRQAFISNPTWENHQKIFDAAGLKVLEYRYYNEKTCGMDFDGMMQDLAVAEPGACVILHACGHNPTGFDPSTEQWRKIADLCRERHLLPVFDAAYLGFVSGVPETDAAAIRLFDQLGLNFFVCISFSKNFGLYSERAGVTLFRASTVAEASAVVSQFKVLSRRLWSVPPMHGATIVLRVLSNPERAAQWRKDLQTQAGRIIRTRRQLFEALHARDPHRDWSQVIKQAGMFSYTGLTAEQCDKLIKDHHIYLLSTGRINVSGIRADAVERVADAMIKVVGVKSAPSVVSADSTTKNNNWTTSGCGSADCCAFAHMLVKK